MVAALNIIDQAEAMGMRVDDRQLAKLFGMPIVRTVGPKGKGLEELLDAVVAASEQPRRPAPKLYGADLEAVVADLVAVLETDRPFAETIPPRWMALKLLEKDRDALKKLDGHGERAAVDAVLGRSIARLEGHGGRDSEILVSEARYGVIHGAAKETVTRNLATVPITEKIDALLINRFLGLPLFLLILWGLFQATFTLGAYPQAWLEAFFGWAADGLRSVMAPGLLRSLLVDGVLGGVGSVLSFVPVIILLFLFISFLEDTGYMSRAAFVMDKFLHLFGLHGQSFLPMMLGFGCSVPAILAARTLKSPKDRIITVLVTPFMSCGAKLPVYILLAGTFFAANAGAVVLAVYLIGAGLALGSAWLFRKTVLAGETTPFVMELPPYRMPTAKGVAWHVWDKSFSYFKKAGTVILAASVLIWAVTTFPQAPEGTPPDQAMAQSAAGWIGKGLEPLVKPLGFDWKIAVATVTGFAAKETVVSTLGILYKVGDGNDTSLRTALAADPVFTPLAAFTFMLFTLLLAPCFAAQATMRAELGTRWWLFYLAYSTFLSWALCFGTYQIGTLFHWGV
jgi:ferrous iron transport protein B